MKVRELQERLAKLNPELDVHITQDLGNPLDIVDVSDVPVTRFRDDDNKARFRHDLDSKDRMAIIEVTDDF